MIFIAKEPMKMRQTFALAALFLSFAVPARSQSLPVRFQPEPDFEMLIRTVAAPLKPRDAFAGLAECAVVDARTFARVTIAQAEQMLTPCMAGVGRRYGATL